jgi:hypothetical protein
MKSKLILAVAALALATLPAQAETPAVKVETPKAEATWVVLLRLRYDLYAQWKAEGKWPDDKAANTALDGHGKYWRQKLVEGVAILAGGMDGDYWDNNAQIIFRAVDKAADPAVKAYVFQAQVRPYNIIFQAVPKN